MAWRGVASAHRAPPPKFAGNLAPESSADEPCIRSALVERKIQLFDVEIPAHRLEIAESVAVINGATRMRYRATHPIPPAQRRTLTSSFYPTTLITNSFPTRDSSPCRRARITHDFRTNLSWRITKKVLNFLLLTILYFNLEKYLIILGVTF